MLLNCFVKAVYIAADVRTAAGFLAGGIDGKNTFRAFDNADHIALVVRLLTADAEAHGKFFHGENLLVSVHGERIFTDYIDIDHAIAVSIEIFFCCLRFALDIDLPAGELGGEAGILSFLADG